MIDDGAEHTTQRSGGTGEDGGGAAKDCTRYVP